MDLDLELGLLLLLRPLSRRKDIEGRHHLMYNESLELTAPQHTAVKT
jgi:hypothetical protein